MLIVNCWHHCRCKIQKYNIYLEYSIQDHTYPNRNKLQVVLNEKAHRYAYPLEEGHSLQRWRWPFPNSTWCASLLRKQIVPLSNQLARDICAFHANNLNPNMLHPSFRISNQIISFKTHKHTNPQTHKHTNKPNLLFLVDVRNITLLSFFHNHWNSIRILVTNPCSLCLPLFYLTTPTKSPMSIKKNSNYTSIIEKSHN